MAGYIGVQPVPQATQTRDAIVATAGQTSFATGGYTPQFLDVYLNGVHLQNGTDYTAANGSDVVLIVGAALDDVLEVVAYSTFDSANTYNRTEADAEFVNDPDGTITVSGSNVGIGTTNPSGLLDVYNDAGAATVNVRGSTTTIIRARQTGNTGLGYFSFGRSDDIFVGGLVYDHDGDNMRFNANNAERMRIDSSGRVGIGKVPATETLEVNGVVKASGGFIFGNTNSYMYEGSNDTINFRVGGNGPYVEFNDAGSGVLELGNAGGELALTSYGAERMRIDGFGRVTMPYQPCFSAKGSGLMTWSAGSTVTQTVPLTSVPTNVGGHFSASTYRFTAPVAGNYLFAAKATQTGTVTGPSLYITKNGTSYGYEISIGYNVAYHSFGGEIIIPLAANDWVDMRISNNNSVALTIDKSRCSLSGFLIG